MSMQSEAPLQAKGAPPSGMTASAPCRFMGLKGLVCFFFGGTRNSILFVRFFFGVGEGGGGAGGRV